VSEPPAYTMHIYVIFSTTISLSNQHGVWSHTPLLYLCIHHAVGLGLMYSLLYCTAKYTSLGAIHGAQA
jgi:hypothetical protein